MSMEREDAKVIRKSVKVRISPVDRALVASITVQER
jgi:hypothetical protein